MVVEILTFQGIDDPTDGMIQMMKGGEEQSFFRVLFLLNFPEGVIKPGDVILISPAVWVSPVQLGRLVMKLSAFIQRSVYGGVRQIEKERIVSFFPNETNGIIGDQLGCMNPVLTAFNELMITVPGMKKRALAVTVVVVSNGSGKTAITLIKPKIVGPMIR